jgi:hypothetical protein
MPEEIHVEAPSLRGLWSPVVGAEATLLLKPKGFGNEEADKILEESRQILAMCLPPTARADARTGLVIGYVQSGKTLSFTTVTALARDNGYRLVIVLAGTKTNLLDQNQERLTGDLGILGERGKFWRTLVNPRADAESIDSVQSAINQWNKYPANPERCRTLLVVVMKNAARLRDLRTLLTKCDLSSTTALIIDDEGDQAGLNTRVRQQEESATYAKILALRRVIPAHTYLQYTATPQAPLLISRIDVLSPEFAELLEPGAGYVGGKDLFASELSCVRLIPDAELPDAHDPQDGPPPSLERAMRLFFLGVAIGVLDGRNGNRTMMIHPSHLRASHDEYAGWARSVRDAWLGTMSEPEGSPDRDELRADFAAAYADLATTAGSLPAFDDLWAELAYAMEDTRVRVVNASQGRIPSFPWSESYGFILVGGAGLDRGFTVEGLTVTYMPRPAGTGTADTIQQRARFFGYKRNYIGLIRIFVDRDVHEAFEAYVEHEESLRSSLKDHRGEPLKDWKRLFFLDSSLQPTRRSVMALDIMRGRGRDWVYPRAPDTAPRDKENRETVDSFVASIASYLEPMPGSAGWTSVQQHRVAQRLELGDVYERLLVPLAVEDEDDALGAVDS